MKLSIGVEELREGMGKILSVIDKKNIRTPLNYVLLKIQDKTLSLHATDLEVSAMINIDLISSTESGSFCLNAKNLTDILRELPNSKLDFEFQKEKNSLDLSCDDINFSLLIYPSDDFPNLQFGNSENIINMKSEQILNIINKTSYAISNDETRIFLNGIFLQEVDSKLRAVATDGHRLALLDSELETGNEVLTNGVIIPRKGILEVKKLAELNLGKDLKISFNESFFYAAIDGKYYLSVRLIAREYPKYQTVIPSKTTYHLSVDRDLMLNAVKRIKIMSNEKSNGVRITMGKEEMTIAANHPSLGHAKEKINISYDGKELDMGFNAKYLIDTLNIFSPGEVNLELNNEISPIIVKSVSLPNYLGIVMPLKL